MSDLAEMTFDENQKTNQKFSISAGDVDYQKESLVILASLGTTKEYLGVGIWRRFISYPIKRSKNSLIGTKK